MIKKGVSTIGKRSIDSSISLDDLGKCPHCGKQYSIRTAQKNKGKCPYCGQSISG